MRTRLTINKNKIKKSKCNKKSKVVQAIRVIHRVHPALLNLLTPLRRRNKAKSQALARRSQTKIDILFCDCFGCIIDDFMDRKPLIIIDIRLAIIIGDAKSAIRFRSFRTGLQAQD